MKRTIILILLALVGLDMYAYDFQVDGIYYSILSPQDLTVEVTYESSSSHNYSGTVTIPETIEYKNKTLTVTGIGKEAFYMCADLLEVKISNQVKEIGEKAFSYCKQLSSIVLPNSVTSIGDQAFSFCTQLSSIVIPNSVTSIGSSAFWNCSSLTQISLPNDLNEISGGLLANCTNLKEIIFPTNPNKIGRSAFKGCTSIETIAIPGSVEFMGDDAFVDCSKLKKIVFEEGEQDIRLGNMSKLYFKDIYADFHYGYFHDCPLEEVILNRNLYWSVQTYSSLTKTIQDYPPFSLIDTFTKLTIGDNVTKIGSYLFKDCNNLTKIELGENVTEIYSNAFQNCSNVKKIVMGKNISKIHYSALDGLYQLESIYVFSETPPEVGTQSLNKKVYTFADVYVPIGTAEQYKTKKFWKDFVNINEFDPTGIINVTENIETPSIIFDIQGRKLSKTKRGINIINGKKVLIK